MNIYICNAGADEMEGAKIDAITEHVRDVKQKYQDAYPTGNPFFQKHNPHKKRFSNGEHFYGSFYLLFSLNLFPQNFHTIFFRHMQPSV